MEQYSLYAPIALGTREFCKPEKHEACPGCGEALALRHIYKTLGPPSELSARWKPAGKKKDGGSRSPLLTLSKGAGADAKPIEILLDNEADLDVTRKDFFLKPDPEKALKKGYPYIATACTSYPFDLIGKLERARKVKGRVFFHVLTPCPVGWGFDEDLTVKVGCRAVESGIFPLYETMKKKVQVTVKIRNPRPLKQYFTMQERFSGLTEKAMAEITRAVNKHYKHLIT
jgi:pyruvate/2-oxoacid:ferredoxin oxidoreductase beta subunit